jgi:hypothetical protein
VALLLTIVSTWLGSMFVYSAGLKLARYDGAASLVTGYRVLPRPVASAAGFLLPWLELLAGGGLLVAIYPLGPALAVSLGTVFAYSSFRVLLRGDDVPCGCTGNVHDRVNRTTLVRALVIASCGAFVLIAGRSGFDAFPVPAVAAVTLASLLPAGLDVYGRVRHHRLLRQRRERERQEIVRLTNQVLAAPPAAAGPSSEPVPGARLATGAGGGGRH